MPCGRGWGPHAKTPWVRASACFADGRGADPKNIHGHGLAEKIQLRQAAAVYLVDSRRLPAVYLVDSQQAAAVHSVDSQRAAAVHSVDSQRAAAVHEVYNHCKQRLQSEASGCQQSLQSAEKSKPPAVNKVYNQSKISQNRL